jgi:transglutaminase-like putative cysteine protease
LRLTALDDFNGRSWKPSNTNVVDSNTVDAIDLPAGLDASTPVVQVSTDVEVGNVRTRWLPVPYAPSKISGLKGQWAWEPDALAIRTDRSNVSGQKYTVASIEATPSVEQLMAAPQDFDASFARYLELPENLPQIVRTTANDVADEAGTDYEAAIALQNYFGGGEFAYSEETPVKEDYDGSGAAALKDFLEVKAGYCVHFSSAMAAMARTLGIPARVAVGFTPGSQAIDPDTQQTVYTVTTYNLHAWPELYFSGVGWVRFEPTPGRGDLPAFAPLSQDDPSTPEVDESVPQPVPTSSASPAPAVTPTTAPSGGPLAPEPTDPTGTGVTGTTAAGSTPWTAIVFAALLVVFLTPCAIRLAQRRRRFGLVESGAALAAWDEIYDTVDDLGMRLVDGLTPRQAAAVVAGYVDDSAGDAVLRLARALETDAYAEQPGEPDPPDLREVLSSLRREAGPGRSVRAALLPISLVRNWLPQAPKYEVH